MSSVQPAMFAPSQVDGIYADKVLTVPNGTHLGSVQTNTIANSFPSMTATNAVPFGQFSVQKIMQNMANAFVGTVQDLFNEGSLNGSSIANTLGKNQRYLYLSLIIIILVIIGDVMHAINI